MVRPYRLVPSISFVTEPNVMSVYFPDCEWAIVLFLSDCCLCIIGVDCGRVVHWASLLGGCVEQTEVGPAVFAHDHHRSFVVDIGLQGGN